MAHTTSARKRSRQNATRKARNKAQRSALRTQLRKVGTAVAASSAEPARTELQKAIRSLDRAARKGLIHKNQAARRKSRLTAKVAALPPAQQ